jgi:hypothetical protein
VYPILGNLGKKRGCPLPYGALRQEIGKIGIAQGDLKPIPKPQEAENAHVDQVQFLNIFDSEKRTFRTFLDI